jgi:hypothetical protein
MVSQAAGAASSPQSDQKGSDKTVVDVLFKKILDQGFLITLPPLDRLKADVELREPDQVVLKVPVTLKASETAAEALEAAARDLGGFGLDAVLEADYGIVSWRTRAIRISSDPQVLEHFQRRVGSLVFLLRLALDDGTVYECSTGDVWRFPITPIRELFSYGGRPTIQGLGISPAFDTKDYGFVTARSQPITFAYPVVIPEADFKRLTGVEGKVFERKDGVSEGECQKSQKNASAPSLFVSAP